MRAGSSPKDSLVPLLHRYYERIAGIESDLRLFVSATDFRVRVERFHDAVRAYTSGVSPYQPGSRLAVEQLAWDIEMLRAIQREPLAPMPGTVRESPSVGVATRMPQAVGDPAPNIRAQRAELIEQYGRYAVLYVALLAELADMNYQSRRDAQDRKVEELAALQRQAKQQPKIDLQQAVGAQIYDPEMLAQLQSALPRGPVSAAQADQALKAAMQQADRQIKGLEQQHTVWLSGQLAMFEQGKDMVQTLLREGLNVAGKFLQDTMGRQGGRGFGGPGR